MEHPGLRLKRNRDNHLALVSPAGRSLGCAMTTEWGMESRRPTMWETLATFKSERREVPSDPLLTRSVIKDLCETAVLPCNRSDLMDRNSWLGLLEPEEETVCHRAE